MLIKCLYEMHGATIKLMLMYFKEIGLEDLDLFALSQVREKWRGIVNTVKHLPLP